MDEAAHSVARGLPYYGRFVQLPDDSLAGTPLPGRFVDHIYGSELSAVPARDAAAGSARLVLPLERGLDGSRDFSGEAVGRFFSELEPVLAGGAIRRSLRRQTLCPGSPSWSTPSRAAGSALRRSAATASGPWSGNPDASACPCRWPSRCEGRRTSRRTSPSPGRPGGAIRNLGRRGRNPGEGLLEARPLLGPRGPGGIFP